MDGIAYEKVSIYIDMGVTIRSRIIGYDNYANGVHNVGCATRKHRICGSVVKIRLIQKGITQEGIQHEVQELGQEEYQESMPHHLQNRFWVVMGNELNGIVVFVCKPSPKRWLSGRQDDRVMVMTVLQIHVLTITRLVCFPARLRSA